jgi:hypothetical protein
MTTTANPLLGRPKASLSLFFASLVLASPWHSASAQPPPVPLSGVPSPTPDLQRDPLLPPDVTYGLGGSAGSPRNNRIRLFRIEPGFLTDPIGVIDDDPPPSGPGIPNSKDSDADWINITLGNDNPYFDFRQRGDPGGLGFYRINTQVQLFDTNRTACSIGFKAFAPAGLESNGLPDNQGNKVIAPALSLYHALDEGTAVQGYVSKNVLVQQGGPAPLQQNLHYGMALQRSLSTMGPETLRNIYLSVGALGQYRFDNTTTNIAATRPPLSWDVLPGLHWKVADNCWVSGGVLLPVGPNRAEFGNGNWQFTCQLQF